MFQLQEDHTTQLPWESLLYGVGEGSSQFLNLKFWRSSVVFTLNSVQGLHPEYTDFDHPALARQGKFIFIVHFNNKVIQSALQRH